MSNRARPFILCIDLDAVCADYETAFKRVVAEVQGVDARSIGPLVEWDFISDPTWPIHSRQEFLDLYRFAVEERKMLRYMPEMPGCSDALWALNDELDVHIRVVTHRLVHNWGHDLAVADTVRWLQAPRSDGRPRIPYRDLCFLGEKADIDGDLFIDDAPHNVAAIREAGIPTMVFTAGYNKDMEGPRADNWDDVYRFASALASSKHLSE